MKIDGLKTGPFRFAKDRWDSQEYSIATTGIFSYDKFQHFFFSLCGTLLIHLFLVLMFSIEYPVVSGIIMAILGFLWEVKDGFIPDAPPNYIHIGKFTYCFGGDGFSMKDFLADIFGIQIAIIINSLFWIII